MPIFLLLCLSNLPVSITPAADLPALVPFITDDFLDPVQIISINRKKAFYILKNKTEDKVYMYVMKGNKTIAICNHSGVIALKVLRTRNRILMVGDDIAIWSPQNRTVKCFKTDPSQSFSSFSISHDEKILVTISDTDLAKVWDMSTGKELSKFKLQGFFPNELLITQDGMEVITGDNLGNIYIYDVKTGRKPFLLRKGTGIDLQKLGTFGDHIITLAFSQKEGRMYALTHRDKVGPSIEIWKKRKRQWVRDGQIRFRDFKKIFEKFQKKKPIHMELTPDGKMIALAFRDGTGVVIDVAQRKTIAQFGTTRLKEKPNKPEPVSLYPRPYFSSMTMSEDGKTIAIGYHDGRIFFYQLPSVLVQRK